MRFSAIIFTFFLSFHLQSQQIITGRVVDAATGDGLLGAHIYLLKDWRKGATSGTDGRFQIELENDHLKDSLVVSYVGFQERVVPMAGDLSIELKQLQIIGETVTVMAKALISEEFQYTEIDKIEIYTNPAAKADPLLAVNSLPSATTTDESANISLRGSSPVETGIFLNNVPVYDAVRYSQLNGIGTFSIFNTAIIEDVTVFPGNPPLEFGNVTSGVISMDTDQRTLEGNTNSLIVSLANIGISREQRINDSQSLKVFSNWQPSSAIKMLNQAALEAIKGFNSHDFGAYWYGSGERLSWKVLSYTNLENYQFRFRHPSFQGIFDQSKVRSFLISSLRWPLGKGELSLSQGASRSKGKYSYSSVKFNVDSRDLFSGLNYHIDNSRYSLKAGLSHDYRNSEINGSFHQYEYALNAEHPIISVNEDATVSTLEGYAYLKVYLSDALVLGTGLRKNLPSDTIDYLSRQVNLSFRKGPWSTIVGVGKYHKTGFFENSRQNFHSASNQLSVDFKYERRDFNVAVSVFDKHASVNNAPYHVRGVELFSEHRLFEGLTASSSLTLLDAEASAEGPFQYDINYFLRASLSYEPANYWTVEAILNSRQGSLLNDVSSASLDTDLNAFRPTFSIDEIRLPNYWNLGISVSKVFLISEDFNLIAFASLNNALNHDNVRGYEYSSNYEFREPALFAQRTGYFGVLFNF